MNVSFFYTPCIMIFMTTPFHWLISADKRCLGLFSPTTPKSRFVSLLVTNYYAIFPISDQIVKKCYRFSHFQLQIRILFLGHD